MQLKNKKLDFYSFVNQFPGENAAHHTGPLRESRGGSGGTFNYTFCRKERVRKGKDWLICIIPVGSGAKGCLVPAPGAIRVGV